MTIRVVFFDFGYVLASPPPGLDPRFLYLDWDGMARITADSLLAPALRPGMGEAQLRSFFDREYYQRFTGPEASQLTTPRSGELLRAILPRVFRQPLTAEQYERLLSHLDTMKYMTFHPAARRVVEAFFHQNYKLGIVSNMILPGVLLERLLQSEGLRPFFGPIITSSETGYIKPHPRIFERALDAGNWRPEEALMVGDTYRQDIIGARSAGMHVIWLNSRGEPTSQAAQNPPDSIINSLEELLTVDL
jgi:HAD superfamily hydrolase (TIGR01549 family)